MDSQQKVIYACPAATCSCKIKASSSQTTTKKRGSPRNKDFINEQNDRIRNQQKREPKKYYLYRKTTQVSTRAFIASKI